MLIVTATNVTKNGATKRGKSAYDVYVGIGFQALYAGRVSGHTRNAGAAELLRRIADTMDARAAVAKNMPILNRIALDCVEPPTEIINYAERKGFIKRKPRKKPAKKKLRVRRMPGGGTGTYNSWEHDGPIGNTD